MSEEGQCVCTKVSKTPDSSLIQLKKLYSLEMFATDLVFS